MSLFHGVLPFFVRGLAAAPPLSVAVTYHVKQDRKPNRFHVRKKGDYYQRSYFARKKYPAFPGMLRSTFCCILLLSHRRVSARDNSYQQMPGYTEHSNSLKLWISEKL